MRIAILAVTVFAALPVVAETPAVFERGMSIPAVLRQLRAAPSPAPEVGAKYGRHVRWMADWKDVVLAPGQDASEKFGLSSTEIVEECNIDPRGGMNCRENFGMTVRKTLRLVIKDRPQVSGPEEFRVMLEGRTVTLWLQNVHQPYAWEIVGDEIVLRPAPKTLALPPVPNPYPTPNPGRCFTDGDCPPGMRCNMEVNMCTVGAP